MATQTLGTLVTKLSLNTVGWAEKIASATKSVEEFADNVEELASKGAAALGDMSDGLLTVAAAAAGAFVLGAQGNQQMADAMKELEGVTRTLAVEFGRELVPLVDEATALVRQGVAAWRNLSVEQKAGIVSGVKWAFVLGTGLKALERGIIFGKSFAEGTVAIARVAQSAGPQVSKAFGSFASGAARAGDAISRLGKSGLGDILKGAGGSVSSGFGAFINTLKGLPAMVASIGPAFVAMAAPIWAALAPVLAVAAAVGSLVVLAAVLRDAWETSGAGISAWFSELASDAVALGQTIGSFVGDVFSNLTAFLRKGVEMAFEFIAAQVRWIAKMAAPVAKWVGADDVSAMFEAMANTSGKKMLEYLEMGGAALWDAGKGAAGAAVDRISSVASTVGDALKSGAATGADILKTSVDSARRGFALLDKDLGLSSMMDRFKGGMSFGLDTSGADKVGVTLTLDETNKAAEEAREQAEEMAALAAAAADESRAEYINSVRAEAHSAAENFRALDAMAEEVRKAAEEARDALLSQLGSRMGDAMSLVETGLQGMAAGGPMGAVAAVIGDLLTRSKAFAGLVTMAGNIIQAVADAFGWFLGGLEPLLGAVGELAMEMMGGLAPVFDRMGQAARLLAPPVMAVSNVLGRILYVFSTFAESLLNTMPLMQLLETPLRMFFEQVKALGVGVLTIARGLAVAWNTIIGGVQDMLRSMAKIPALGALADWANALESSKAPLAGIISAHDALREMTWEGMDAVAQEAAARWRNVESMEALNAELLNAPKLWKRNAAAASAQDGQASPYVNGGPGPTPPPWTMPPAGGGGSPPAAPAAVSSGGNMYVTVQAHDVEGTANALASKRDDFEFRRAMRDR